ncbi:MAG: hypothetical protein QM723_32665 [Myxococcaceae bacterium]
MRALLVATLLVLAGCGGSSEQHTCTADFTGNFSDHTAALTNCPRISKDSTGEAWVFHFKVASPAGQTTDEGTISLGANASATSLASGGGSVWATSATREPGCVYSAGDQAVPTGSFQLTLDTVDTAKGDATGRLELRQYVHAQPMTDCGQGDEEVLVVDF